MTSDQRRAGQGDPVQTPPATRFYFLADTLVRLALRAAEAIHRGFWLGLLDHRGLDAATRAMYRSARSYAESAYNQSGFNYWEEGMVSRHFDGVRRVLVAAAGGGREIIALSRRGIHADGFDPDAGFVAVGNDLLRELGIAAHLRVCGPGQVPADLPGYDAVIIGWNGYTHIPGQGARIAFLRALATQLRPGGRLLMSFFPRAERERPFLLSWWVGRLVGALRLRREPVELGDTLMVGYFHYFSKSQLRAELDAAGLDMLEYSDHPQGHAAAARRSA